MLVNLTEKPGSLSKSERNYRGIIKHYRHELDKSFIRYVKAIAGFKRFEPYKPTGHEFSDDTTSNFTGCYVYYGLCSDACDDIKAYTKQTPFSFKYAELNYDPDSEAFEYWDHYGLCDNATQAIRFYYQRKAEGKYPGNHVIILRPMNGDFRWHKWGRYIGDFTPSCEYFSDEVGIEMVYSYDIVHIK